jgi:type IV secretory pathway TrbF-like protein
VADRRRSRARRPPHRRHRLRLAQLQHKIVPYGVAVDSLGAAVAIKPAAPGGHRPDERIVRYQLAVFVRGARPVMTDRIAIKNGLEGVYVRARACSHRPRRLLPRQQSLRDREDLRRLSPASWQIRWTEEQRGLDGLLLGMSQWEGVVTTEIAPPTSENAIQVPPLDLYVTDLRWTNQATVRGPSSRAWAS